MHVLYKAKVIAIVLIVLLVFSVVGLDVVVLSRLSLDWPAAGHELLDASDNVVAHALRGSPDDEFEFGGKDHAAQIRALAQRLGQDLLGRVF